MEVADYVAKTDALLTEAEAKLPAATVAILPLLREAVASILRAFLLAKSLSISGDPLSLYQRSLELEPEFAAVEAEIDSLFDDDEVNELEAEEVLDKANEVWDFVSGLLSQERAWE